MARLREGNPNRICLHHSAIQGIPADLTALKKRLAIHEIYHSKKTWAETIKTKGEYGYYYLEYHIAIAGNGHELRVQDDKYVLYHAGDNAKGDDSFNLHGIAVLIDGNYMTDKPNANQLEAFARIIARFEKQYKVDVLVRGHKQTSLSATSCPGTNLGDNTKGFLKDAIDRANVIIKENLPTNPLQDDLVAPEPTECEKRIKILEETITHLVEAQRSLERDKKSLGERVDFLEGTLAIREKEISDLESDYNRVFEERNRFEQEKLALQLKIDELSKPHWTERLRDRLYELWDEFKENIISFIKRK